MEPSSSPALQPATPLRTPGGAFARISRLSNPGWSGSFEHDVLVVGIFRAKSIVRRPAPQPDPHDARTILSKDAAAEAWLNWVNLPCDPPACWFAHALRLEDKEVASLGVLFVDPRHSSRSCQCCVQSAEANQATQRVPGGGTGHRCHPHSVVPCGSTKRRQTTSILWEAVPTAIVVNLRPRAR
jgi:hypothetical protein